jgi:NADH-quinone oxidoreductase subunit J
VLLVLTIGYAVLPLGPAGKNSAQFGNANVTSLAHLIFTRYVYPFEITSALLITAAVGAMVLAHRERLAPKPTQREMAAARIAGSHPTPLPGPGTYAQHNAVDMPALLPDGSQSELSVSPVLTGGRPASVSTEAPPALGGRQPDGAPGLTRGPGSAPDAEAGEQ